MMPLCRVSVSSLESALVTLEGSQTTLGMKYEAISSSECGFFTKPNKELALNLSDSFLSNINVSICLFESKVTSYLILRESFLEFKCFIIFTGCT